MFMTAYDQDADGIFRIMEEAETDYYDRAYERIIRIWNEQYDLVMVTSKSSGEGKRLRVWFEGQKVDVPRSGREGRRRIRPADVIYKDNPSGQRSGSGT